jgi:hypothetical protein
VIHLGVYVSKEGFINNIDNSSKSYVKINLVKGYFYSKLNYSAPFITITDKQIETCNNIIKWFIGITEKEENRIVHYHREKKYKDAVELYRISFPQHLGGKKKNSSTT